MADIVILGGGFAGTAVARGLGSRARVTLISDDNYVLFTPMLAEVAAAEVEPRHILAPIRQMCPKARVVVGTVVAVDGWSGTAEVRSPITGRTRTYRGDALVLATGSRSERTDARLTHLVVVGAGYSGAELAASMADMMRAAAAKFYRDAPPPRVTLVDTVDRVVPMLPERSSIAAAGALRDRGVRLVLGHRVTRVHNGGLDLEDGTTIEAATVVWAGGVEGAPLPGDLGGVPGRDGRLPVDERLRVNSRVLALGDTALVPDGRGGTCPPTAQHALRQGRYLGSHLPDMLAGRQVPPFRYRTRGELVALGRRNAVGRIGGVEVGGLFAWFLEVVLPPPAADHGAAPSGRDRLDARHDLSARHRRPRDLRSWAQPG